MREQIELLKNHAQLQTDGAERLQRIAVVVARAKHVLADSDLAGLECLKAVEAAQECAFSSARRTDHRGDVAFRDRQRNAAEHGQRAVILLKIGGFDHCLPSPANWRSLQRAKT